MTQAAKRLKIPLYLRFWSKVRLGDGCWEWTGCRGAGYGQIADENRVNRRATHVMWFLRYGRWPEKWLLHSCDNPPCVNPAHLSEGDHTENQRQSAERKRHVHSRKTRCKHGHPFTPENTHLYHKERRCLACRAADQRARRESRRSQHEHR